MFLCERLKEAAGKLAGSRATRGCVLLDGNFPVAERFVKAGSLEGKTSLGPKRGS